MVVSGNGILELECKEKGISIKIGDASAPVASSWEEIRSYLLDLYRASPYWIFRGMTDGSYNIETTYDRKRIDRGYREALYGQIIEQFIGKAVAYQESDYIPQPNELFEIQSIMQHYGAPTVLLDWTHSPYVACYFASEDAMDHKQKDGVVYALDSLRLSRILEKCFREESLLTDEQNFEHFRMPDIFRKIIEHKHQLVEGFVMPVEPAKANKRISIQQGLFTVNGNIRYNFEENLALQLDYSIRSEKRQSINVLRRIIIPKELKSTIQEDLLLMNITASTLFPGLEGFAKSWAQVMLQSQERMNRFIEKVLSLSSMKDKK